MSEETATQLLSLSDGLALHVYLGVVDPTVARDQLRAAFTRTSPDQSR